MTDRMTDRDIKAWMKRVNADLAELKRGRIRRPGGGGAALGLVAPTAFSPDLSIFKPGVAHIDRPDKTKPFTMFISYYSTGDYTSAWTNYLRFGSPNASEGAVTLQALGSGSSGVMIRRDFLNGAQNAGISLPGGRVEGFHVVAVRWTELTQEAWLNGSKFSGTATANDGISVGRFQMYGAESHGIYPAKAFFYDRELSEDQILFISNLLSVT